MGSLIVLAVSIIPWTAWSTHETDHRFTVYGYVRDGDGNPVEDQRVMVVDTRIGEGATAFTDRSGYYEVLLHLHNSNMGDEIRITAANASKTIAATFDPDDAQTERRVQVDFGAPPREGEAPAGASSGIWLYGAGAFLLLAALLYWGVYSKRKRAGAKAPKGPKKGKRS